MPNKVWYSDEKTVPKAMRAIAGGGAFSLDQVLDVVDRIQAAGVVFVEPIPAANKNDAPVQD